MEKVKRHLVWKDELGYKFILLKFGEVYRYSKKTIRCIICSSQKASSIRKMGSIFYDWGTSDGLYILETGIGNLGQIIQLGAFKQRPRLKGRWLEKAKEKLAHDIIPYNPKSKEILVDEIWG